jgi:hypothetical protein
MPNQAQKLLEALEQDRSLREPEQLRQRIEALDTLELHFSDGDATGAAEPGTRAGRLRLELETANEALYRAIREAIRRGRGRDALLRWVPAVGQASGAGYDHLDELVSGVLRLEPPDAVEGPGPEMVFYQPTPARHLFELIRQAAPGAGDLLVDLGSGLGHLPLLTAICTPARAIGIEREAAYVECARRCAEGLNLPGASFVCQDARAADLSRGTLFYLYTPFSGSILRAVLDQLRREAACREIRVFTFGPCTATVAAEPWLAGDGAPASDRVALFRAR